MRMLDVTVLTESRGCFISGFFARRIQRSIGLRAISTVRINLRRLILWVTLAEIYLARDSIMSQTLFVAGLVTPVGSV